MIVSQRRPRSAGGNTEGSGTAVRPFLRWAGSKRSLLPTLASIIPPFKRYIEPFAGSACLFFRIQPKKAMLGDLNSELIRTYRAVRNEPKLVGHLLNAMPNTSEFYYSLRQEDPSGMHAIERAARFLYLNRHCFNGVYRTNRQGQFNVPRGVKTGTPPSTADLLACSACLKRASLFSGDFGKLAEEATSGDFVYLDPPYPSKLRSTHGEYGYGAFADSDLPRLIEALRIIDAAGAKFILSYIDTPKTTPLFRPWGICKVTTQKHVSGFAKHRSAISELLVSNYRLGPTPEAKRHAAVI